MNFIGADVCVTMVCLFKIEFSKKLFCHKFCKELTEANGSKQNVDSERDATKRDEK